MHSAILTAVAAALVLAGCAGSGAEPPPSPSPPPMGQAPEPQEPPAVVPPRPTPAHATPATVRPRPAAVVRDAPATTPASPAAAPANVAASGSAGNAEAYCPAMEDFATAAECANYGELAANAPLGVASLGAARDMKMGELYPVRLIVGRAERRKAIEAAAGAPGDVASGDLKLAPWICAELQAVDFEVRGEKRQCRQRSGSPQVSFAWEVSPQREEVLQLSATVQSLSEENGRPLDQVDSETIRVTVVADGISRFDDTISRLTESVGGLRTFLLAIVGLLGVLSVIVWRIRNLGKKPDKDALKELTAA